MSLKVAVFSGNMGVISEGVVKFNYYASLEISARQNQTSFSLYSLVSGPVVTGAQGLMFNLSDCYVCEVSCQWLRSCWPVAMK